jgi:hypothetical protein
MHRRVGGLHSKPQGWAETMQERESSMVWFDSFNTGEVLTWLTE